MKIAYRYGMDNKIDKCPKCNRVYKISLSPDSLQFCDKCNSWAKIGERYCGRHLPKDRSKLCDCGYIKKHQD